jgi:hypothetical protein
MQSPGRPLRFARDPFTVWIVTLLAALTALLTGDSVARALAALAVSVNGAAWMLNVGGSASSMASGWRAFRQKAGAPTPAWAFTIGYWRAAGAVTLVLGLTWMAGISD